MQLNLHKNARTTPAIRRELRESTQPTAELARRYNLSKPTVRKWRQREDGADRSHRPQRLHTTLTSAQEAVVVALRQTLLLPLDDLLAVTREFVCAEVSRSGLDRCLRRHGVADLKALRPQEEVPKVEVKAFKDYEPGFVHVDVKYLPQLPDEQARRYLFAAIDRATRWVYVEVLPEKSAACAQGFLERLLKAAPFKVAKVLTDNGKEFTDRFCATGERQPTGQHPFDRVCAEHAIDHRLIKPRHPQTNGLVERFNGRIAEVLATRRFRSGEHLEDTLIRYVNTYNHHIPQRALGHISPVEALQEWYQKKPELFVSEVNNLPGLDTNLHLS
jgi:transposase InsO family protein